MQDVCGGHLDVGQPLTSPERGAGSLRGHDGTAACYPPQFRLVGERAGAAAYSS